MADVVVEALPSSSNALTGRWMVVIFNNDDNSFEEVISILVEATGCTIEEASIETWEADAYGKAPVHFSSKSECERVADIISSIGIKTQVTEEWHD